MNWYELGPFTIFDIETTGMSPVRDRIVELAAVRVDLDGSQKNFSSLLNPGCSIPPRASSVHHITDDMVKNAPFFGDIAEDFLNFIEGSKLVAHNATFDLSFIQESLVRDGFSPWKGETYDSLKIARDVYPDKNSHNLQDLRKTLGLTSTPGMNPHRAAADVEWTRQLLAIMLTAMINARK